MAKGKVIAAIKLAALVAFIAVAVYFFRFTDTGRTITPAAVVDHIKSYDPFTSRLVYVLFYILGSVILLPGTVMSFAGAVLFGAYEGTLYTWIGATIGAVLAFLLAKLLGRDSVNQLLGGRFEAFDRRITENGFMGLLLIRLVPLFPFNGVNFGCGLTGIRFRDYLLATAIGILPGTFVYQYLFAKLGEKIFEQGFHWEDLSDPGLLGALALFVVFVIAGKWLAGKFHKKGAEPIQNSNAENPNKIESPKL